VRKSGEGKEIQGFSKKRRKERNKKRKKVEKEEKSVFSMIIKKAANFNLPISCPCRTAYSIVWARLSTSPWPWFRPCPAKGWIVCAASLEIQKNIRRGRKKRKSAKKYINIFLRIFQMQQCQF
jgi:hypothetical protein